MSGQIENASAPSGKKAEPPAVRLLDGRFELNLGAPLPELDSPHATAFAVHDRKGEHAALYGLVVAPGIAWRGSIAKAQSTLRHPSLLRVLAIASVLLPGEGAARAAIIVERPRGRRLSTRSGPLTEEMLRAAILPSLIDGLQALHDHDITHRAIRPNNLFFASEGEDGIVLGDYISAPPGHDQAADFEVIERATASPEGRGEGTPACDLFALGVTIARLLDGQPEAPDDATARLIARMERGSFDVLAGRIKCSAIVRELISGLLTDDEEHRWTLDSIRDWLLNQRASGPGQWRPRDSGRPYMIHGQPVSHPRAASYLFAKDVEATRQDLQRGHLTRWLRANPGKHELADEIEKLIGRMDELARGRRTVDEDQVARVCCILDRSGPIRHRGLAIMPDGFAAALAQAYLANNGDAIQTICRMIELGLPSLSLRSTSPAVGGRLEGLHLQLRNHIRNKWAETGIVFCLYELNPELPCLSPLVRNDLPIGANNFLKALDHYVSVNGATVDRLLDDHALAYVSMQVSADTIKKAHAIAFKIRATNEAVTELALFAALQVNSDASPVSHLARWLIDRIIPMFDRVHSAARRSRLARDFRAKATVGDLNALLGALLDPKERRADDKEYSAALYRYRELGMQLLWLKQTPGQRRLVAATALGHRIATGIGVVTLVGATLVSLFGRVP